MRRMCASDCQSCEVEQSRGVHSSAGEFGHTIIEIDGPRCECQQLGCVEEVHRRAVAAGDIAAAARAVAIGIANTMHVVDVSEILLAGGDFDRHVDAYLHALRVELAGTLAGPTAYEVGCVLPDDYDLVAMGAAVMLLSSFYGFLQPARGAPAQAIAP